MSIKPSIALTALCIALLSLSAVQAQDREQNGEQGSGNTEPPAQDKNSDAGNTGEAKASTAPAVPPTRRFTPTEEIRADSILSLPADM